MANSSSARNLIAFVVLLGVCVVGMFFQTIWSAFSPLAQRAYFDWRAVPAEAQVVDTSTAAVAYGRYGRETGTRYEVRYTYQAPHPQTGVVIRFEAKQPVVKHKYRDIQGGLKTLPIRYVPDNPAWSDLANNPATNPWTHAAVLILLAPLGFIAVFLVGFLAYMQTLPRTDRIAVQGDRAL